MDRRIFVKTGGAAIAGLSLSARGHASSGERPNILWLVSEDNSPLLGCYGDSFADTPNLDRLARESVLFTHAFANTPVCAPSRSTLYTGMYNASLGTMHQRSNHPIPAHMRLFPEYLREAGYYCINGNKTDYNMTRTPKEAWDGRQYSMSLKETGKRQPFFRFINYLFSHESMLHTVKPTQHDPDKVKLAPYHPDTPEIRHDYAQYYDHITLMDNAWGKVFAELNKLGLAEDTIVFCFSDHGGVLPRSKRFVYDSGLRVPMLVRFPRKYQHLCPWSPGSRVDRLISFVDLAPTVLGLAGLPVPDHMQGTAFLGNHIGPEPDYVHGNCDRMDERYDMSRSVRDKKFRYIRNYYPHLPWGRHNDYLWKMPAMRSWEEEYNKGGLNEIQARFFGPKPAEELYDLEQDPYEVNNLADNPGHEETLVRLREVNRRCLTETRDLGFLPEAEMCFRSEGTTPCQMAQDPAQYDLKRIMEVSELAGQRDAGNLDTFKKLLSDPDSAARYWAAVGCSALADQAKPAVEELQKALGDDSPDVQIIAAEALLKLGHLGGDTMSVLKKSMTHKNTWVSLHAADAIYNTGVETDPAIVALVKSAKQRHYLKVAKNSLW